MAVANAVQKPDELVQLVDRQGNDAGAASRGRMRKENLMHRASAVLVFNSEVLSHTAAVDGISDINVADAFYATCIRTALVASFIALELLMPLKMPASCQHAANRTGVLPRVKSLCKNVWRSKKRSPRSSTPCREEFAVRGRFLFRPQHVSCLSPILCAPQRYQCRSLDYSIECT